MQIKHPTTEDYNLNFEGLIGPENAVFFRGRVSGRDKINLPDYWPDLVETGTISVHLTPTRSHQDIIVKGIGENKVFLQSKGGLPIDCYYLIIGERKDVPKLEVVTGIDVPN